MKILIAGGAGFIGSHLCDRLLAEGANELICVDNLITGSMKNISHHQNNPKFKFVEFDISSGPLPLGEKIDYVINLASPASPVDYHKYSIETLRVGSFGVYYTLEFARRQNAKYLFSSTSEVYGDPEISPQVETYWGRVNPNGPRSQYDEAKRFAEALIVAYRRQHKTDCKIIRIFNTYGPRMRKDDGRVVPNFISQALARKPLSIYGEGYQTRSFCYVDDLVEGIVSMMHSREIGPVNLGNPDEFMIRDLAEEVAGVLGIKVKLQHLAFPTDDPKMRCPDITLAKEKLQWQPKIGLKEGLNRTIKWFRDN